MTYKLKLIKNLDELFTQIAFTIYSQCMYKPTKEKYRQKMSVFLKDKDVKVFTCYQDNMLVGIIVIYYKSRECVEIKGIAVDKVCSNKGIGSFMIQQIIKKEESLIQIEAETDDDSVGFYQKNGFKVTKYIKKCHGGNVVRYRCKLTVSDG